MFDLYKMKNPGERFPRTKIGSYEDPQACMKEHRLTKDEMSRLMDGKVALNQYYIEFWPAWMRNIAVNSLIEENGAMPYNEIAEALGVSESCVRATMHNALKKLRLEPAIKMLFDHVIRDMDFPRDFDVTSTAKITVEVE